MKVKIYKTNGSIEEIYSSKDNLLNVMQKAVGGYIEPVVVEGKRYAVNEEGLILGLKRNKTFPQFVGSVVEWPDEDPGKAAMGRVWDVKDDESYAAKGYSEIPDGEESDEDEC